jgi:hypothetical protein
MGHVCIFTLWVCYVGICHSKLRAVLKMTQAWHHHCFYNHLIFWLLHTSMDKWSS